MTFKNILVPYDGSVSAIRAFNKAMEMTKQHESNLHIVTCLNIENLGGWYKDKRINKDILKNARNLTEKNFSKLNDIAEKNSIHASFIIMESKNIVKDLISFAKSKHIDLIMMGSFGRGKFDKVLLGSVSNGVMLKAKCPVLIIK